METNWLSPVAASLLAAVYALRSFTGEGKVARLWETRGLISAAAGVSVAYVFIDVLPELAEYNALLAKAGGAASLYAEQRIYLLVLASFVVMYGLQHIVLSARDRRHESLARTERDAIYWLHLLGYAAYSALIGYLLVERSERGTASILLYTLAMGIHFLIVNHALAEEHGAVYRRHGHLWLAVSVLAGWAAGAMLPIDAATFARLFAVLAGGVVITSLRSELPNDRTGRFWPFCIGALIFAVLLILA
jgi:uncharacterized membrane protein YeaQ/YmgE (transglycosylase-associated protein family)